MMFLRVRNLFFCFTLILSLTGISQSLLIDPAAAIPAAKEAAAFPPSAAPPSQA
jgi:hypothetical protein